MIDPALADYEVVGGDGDGGLRIYARLNDRREELMSVWWCEVWREIKKHPPFPSGAFAGRL